MKVKHLPMWLTKDSMLMVPPKIKFNVKFGNDELDESQMFSGKMECFDNVIFDDLRAFYLDDDGYFAEKPIEQPVFGNPRDVCFDQYLKNDENELSPRQRLIMDIIKKVDKKYYLTLCDKDFWNGLTLYYRHNIVNERKRSKTVITRKKMEMID